MVPPSRDNHFVSQFYLRAWQDPTGRVQMYRTLVSRAQVPEWVSQTVKGVGYIRDLYSSPLEHGLDTFERWTAEEFETPAVGAVTRAISGGPLADADHRALGRFFALQDVRTPSSLLASQERWETLFRETMQSVVSDLEANPHRLALSDSDELKVSPAPSSKTPTFQGITVGFHQDAAGSHYIKAEIISPRAFWLKQMTSLLSREAIKALESYRWSLATPHGDEEWPTSDCPVLKLMFESPSSYHFSAGYGEAKCDLMMPLSPRCLLYAQVGEDHPERFKMNAYQTRLLQRLLAERAHRSVFARNRLPSVSADRQRLVDEERYAQESAFWTSWGDANFAMEAAAGF